MADNTTTPKLSMLWLKDTAERMGWAFLYSIIVIVPLLSGPMNDTAKHTIIITVIPAALTFVLNFLAALLPFIPSVGKTFWTDSGFRILRTVIVSLGTAFGAAGLNLFDLNAVRLALITVGMALAATIKAIIVLKLKSGHSAPAPTASVSPASLVSKAA